MRQTSNQLMRAATALLAAFSAFYILFSHLQFTAQQVEIEGFFPPSVNVEIYNVTASGYEELLSTLETHPQSNSSWLQTLKTPYFNQPIKQLRLRFTHKQDDKQNSLSLTKIKVVYPYLVDYYFIQDNIPKFFNSPQTIEKDARSYSGKIINLTSLGQVAKGKKKLPLIIATLFGLGVWVVLGFVSFKQLPAFKDMKLGKKISSTNEFNTINGLRGLAALLVLFSHTAPAFEAVQMGLAILFVISGFLLSKPYVLDSGRIFSGTQVQNYLIKRIKRILPMYFFYVLLLYSIPLDLNAILRHVFFIQADGHLWPMTQIFAFYMLLPALLIFTSLAHRLNIVFAVIFLAILSYLSFIYLRDWKPFYNSRFFNEFFLYAFLIGVMGSYLHYGVLKDKVTSVLNDRIVIRHSLGIAAGVFTCLMILWSAPMKPSMEIFKWVSQFWVKCVASTAIILLALNTPKTLFNSLMSNWLFRSVGVIGFSFYILHGLGMQIFEQIQIQFLGSASPGGRSWEFVIGAFCVTYMMALITYSYVERPFFGYREKSSTQ